MHHHVFRIVAGIVLCGLVGCGEKRVDVSGKVTYNAKVLGRPKGVIVFVNDKEEQVKADVGLDGEYRATGVTTGHNRVVVYYVDPTAPKGKPRPAPGQPVSTQPMKSVFLTPEKYTNSATSGLATEVQAGTPYNVDLVGPNIR